MKKILVVDQDAAWAGKVCRHFINQQWEALTCGSAEEALQLIAARRPDLVLTEHMLPALDANELARRLRVLHSRVPLIVMCADGDARAAVDAMKAGACDYVTKPISLSALLLVVEKALRTAHSPGPPSVRNPGQSPGEGVDAIIGVSPVMLALKATIRQLLLAEQQMADGGLPAVLIEGETGAGKELVARALHVDGTHRRGPLIEINCASIPEHLLESELCGFERGAFTDATTAKAGLVEAADGGTLFLDEIGEIGPAIQAKLLKVLEDRKIRRLGAVTEKTVNVRFISATNRDLENLVRGGIFRSDLYFRLHIISIKVPPLRARGADILLLARHFLTLHGRRYGKPALYFSAAAERALLEFPWPGNVRELRNVIERTVLFAPDEMISLQQLAIYPGLSPRSGGNGGLDRGVYADEPVALDFPKWGLRLTGTDKKVMLDALEQTDWNVTKSARRLGLSRDQLRYRIEILNLEPPETLARRNPSVADRQPARAG